MKYSDIPLKLLRWKIEGNLPSSDIRKYIVIGGKHTSNWDYVIMLAAAMKLKKHPKALIKKEAFIPPLGFLLRELGGVPIDRSNPKNTIDKLVIQITESTDFILVITPEGSRSNIGSLKTGFYRISEAANIPILPVTIHSNTKTLKFHGIIEHTSKIQVIERVNEIFSTSTGIKNYSET